MIEVLNIDEWDVKKSPKFKIIREFVAQRLKDDLRFSIDDLVRLDGDYDYYQIIGFSKNNRDVHVLSNANQFEIQVDINYIHHITQLKNIAFSD